ncbi:DNA helicase [Leucobacter sp. Psy1]|uniref:UrvD/REP family ATP-dependent DNA helicase n=1 Tax=Leucobacter sp. Psy1 TaxID=2875729 RepID=UPI001CD78146|nr:UrvD/REP family ATP-dependent DNA helicase [Leucobacter sp. Psy1]UBH06580.1 DNA helicase [Leucobacter sp. Psy1]
MLRFDETQRSVLALDASRHASVLGAPGTGKTTTLIESFARRADAEGWQEGDLLVLAPSRASATRLRDRVHQRLGRASGGTLVRTPASLAFALLARRAAEEGREPPRLLTGTVQDELIGEVIEAALVRAETGHRTAWVERFAPELLRSAPFRAELRELVRVLDDASLSPETLMPRLEALEGARSREAVTALPAPELVEVWLAALELLTRVQARIAEARPGELTSSGLLRAAAAMVRASGDGGGAVPLPRLILIDDAHELTEGDLALVAACAREGARIWVFGDPDVATSAFRGERVELLTRMEEELARQGFTEGSRAARSRAAQPQRVVLGVDHRSDPAIRGLVRRLTERVGAAGAGAQRAAVSARSAEPTGEPGSGRPATQFVTVPAVSEQLGVIAHRLRRRRLGLDDGIELDWSDMAVVCRTREEAGAAARTLAGLGVVTAVTAGGIVLREHRIVRELIRLLQHALGIAPLTSSDAFDVLGGDVGGLDPIVLRRFRAAIRLSEQRAARGEAREPKGIDELVVEALGRPEAEPIVDSAAGRALRRLARLAEAGTRVRASGGTPRETLWAIWDATGLAGPWQESALDGRGARADDAHRRLDAVLGLFFALQRHEEQDSEVPIADLLAELLASAVPEDSLAASSAREVVTVTTPQGLVGTDFSLVAILGPQDGVWPNLRSRGTLIGVTALERWLRGGIAEPPARRDTLHDELRLFAHACSRARDELLVVAVADEDHHPSTFFGIAHPRFDGALPSSRLTLRGAVAEMRRRLTRDPADAEASASLAALASEGVPGAHPDEWYGVLPPSTEAPLVDLDGDPEAVVPVSPSHLDTVERCPLDWAMSRLGGGTTTFSSQLGTLLHHAFERVDDADPEALLAIVSEEWDSLEFESGWEEVRSFRLAEQMTHGLAEYLADFAASERELVGREAEFSVRVDRAELRGTADRLERVHGTDGRRALLVIDLKTGKTAPGGAALEAHAQLQAYQFGVLAGAFDAEGGSAGAALVFVHPDALRARDGAYSLRSQQPLTPEARAEFGERVAAAARVMAAGAFTARVEHHCSDEHSPGGACRLHVIPAVSAG